MPTRFEHRSLTEEPVQPRRALTSAFDVAYSATRYEPSASHTSLLQQQLSPVQPLQPKVASSNRTWRPPPSRTTGEFVPRFGLQAPLFNGDDPVGWIFGIQEYFNYFLTTEDVRLAVMDKLIEYPATDWFHHYQQINGEGSWEDFLVALCRRFAPELFEGDSQMANHVLQSEVIVDAHNDVELDSGILDTTIELSDISFGQPVMVTPSKAEKSLVQPTTATSGVLLGPYSGGATRLCVDNLPLTIKEDHVRQMIEQFDAVELVQMPDDLGTRNYKARSIKNSAITCQARTQGDEVNFADLVDDEGNAMRQVVVDQVHRCPNDGEVVIADRRVVSVANDARTVLILNEPSSNAILVEHFNETVDDANVVSGSEVIEVNVGECVAPTLFASSQPTSFDIDISHMDADYFLHVIMHPRLTEIVTKGRSIPLSEDALSLGRNLAWAGDRHLPEIK